MESERDPYQDLYSHLENKEWSDVQIVNYMQQIAMGGLTRHIHAIHNLLIKEQQIDERIAAEREYDRIFSTQPVFTPDRLKAADEARSRVERARERLIIDRDADGEPTGFHKDNTDKSWDVT